MKTNFKGIFGKTVIMILIVTLVLSFSNVTLAAETSQATTRLAGQTRYETAKIIAESYQSGKVQNVVISTGTGFADALSASVLAHEKSAPILLVDATVSGSQDAYDYITQHLDSTGTVYITGGTGVINKEFETKLNTLGFNNIIRIAGYDRYETSYQLANSLSSSSTVVIASGESYPDALSISSFAANKGWPILLTTKDVLPQVMKNYLSEKKPSKVYIIGGTGVISDNVKSQISGILPQVSIERLAGQDRFDTNAIIAQTFKPSPSTIYVATGYGFADALAGSSLAAKNGDPIMFVDPSTSTLPKSIANYFKQLYANNLNPNLVVFGGTSVVPNEVLTNATDLMLGIVKVDPTAYLRYEDKMKTFGFEKLYINKSANPSQPVTKAESLKLAIAVVFNTDDISGMAAPHNEYENATWVEFAKFHGITNENINISNYSEKAKYIDVISYFEKSKLKFLKTQPVKDTVVNLKDISNYSQEEQAAVRDMIANEIISLPSNTLNGNNDISKGQLNELVVNFAEKYNTIALKGDTINLDPQKMPSNSDQYPYILSNVDKAIYEIPLVANFPPDAYTSKEMYQYKKELYPQIKSDTEGFFNYILNIDYMTITEENLREKLKLYLINPPNENTIVAYVKHVKDNEIVIEGNSRLIVPVIYSDGMTYRARVQLTFQIKHSNTRENLLYLDFREGKKIYTKINYDFLADYSLSDKLGGTNMYLNEFELYKAILDKGNCGITKEVEN